MKNKNLFLIIILSLVLVFSCEKEEIEEIVKETTIEGHIVNRTTKLPIVNAEFYLSEQITEGWTWENKTIYAVTDNSGFFRFNHTEFNDVRDVLNLGVTGGGGVMIT
jgi:hypothetical protein